MASRHSRAVQPDDRRLAILAFHKIGEPSDGAWTTWNYIAEGTFVTYLTHLQQGEWQVIDIATALRGMAEPDVLPRRAVLLTFDDGYRSMRGVVLRWLRRFGFPAVVFVPTAFIGGRNTFDAGIEPEEEMCDWDDLRELERNGIAVESHSVSHRRFSELGPVERATELAESKAALEAGLGKRLALFAYPYGDDGGPEAWAMRQRLESAGYQAACLYGGGPNRFPIEDRYRLRRVAMGPDSDLRAMLK